MNKQEPNQKRPTAQINAAGFGIQMAASFGIFTYLGIKADERWNSSPWGLLGCLALAFIYGAYEIWKMVLLISPKKDDANNDDRKH